MSSASERADPRVLWNHNLQFHGWILGHMPHPCESALDVGCGDGVLTRKLAERAAHVTGIDAAPDMVALAKERHAAENISYVTGDIVSYPWHTDSFDFIAAVAVIHHMPLAAVLERMAALLRRGGVLAVVGLARNTTLADHAFSAASVPLSRLVRMRTGYWDSPAPRLEPEETFVEIRRLARRTLPGVDVRRRLFFRYTLLWRRP